MRSGESAEGSASEPVSFFKLILMPIYKEGMLLFLFSDEKPEPPENRLAQGRTNFVHVVSWLFDPLPFQRQGDAV